MRPLAPWNSSPGEGSDSVVHPASGALAKPGPFWQSSPMRTRPVLLPTIGTPLVLGAPAGERCQASIAISLGTPPIRSDKNLAAIGT